jgi:leucyl-tRNA synthetase
LTEPPDFAGKNALVNRDAIVSYLENKNLAHKKTSYRMRDAIFARQRYWGEPIPLIHDASGLITPIPEKNLPLELPKVKSYAPTGNGESPLSGVPSWVKAGYETNTMPGWAGSSWYFLRYADPKNKKSFASEEELDYWFGKNGGVQMYVGGAEHATGHLLYSRFWHKVLKDLGHVKTEEPFLALRNQGMIGGADGRKMSKRWGNIINPDDVVHDMGADTMRVYEAFMGPFDSHLPWSTDGIVGSRRFIERVWRLVEKVSTKKSDQELIKALHKSIKKVSDDIPGFAFNTAVSSMMIFVNVLEKSESVHVDDFKKFLQILAPFAPHIAEELWTELGEKGSIHLSSWPAYNTKLIVEDTVTLGVQVNGKVRAEVVLSISATEMDVKKLVLAISEVQKWISGKEIKKFIFIPKKIISIVV